MAEKLPISIYKIEDEHKLDALKQHVLDSGFQQQESKSAGTSKYKLFLFYQRMPTTPRWKKFIATITQENEKILEIRKSANERFVLLLQNKTSKNIYAVTGGAGHFVIQDYASNSFGIDVISRIIKKEDKILRAARETSLVGGILGATKYFRNNLNLFENDGFGKIYQELKTNLDKDVLVSKLGLSEEDIKKGTACVAKSSFRIDKAITYDELLKLIDGCESLLDEDEIVAINNVEKLYKKRSRELIDKLNDEIVNQLWLRLNDRNRGVDFDLCHPKFEEYLTSSKFVVTGKMSSEKFSIEIERLCNIDQLYECIRVRTHWIN